MRRRDQQAWVSRESFGSNESMMAIGVCPEIHTHVVEGVSVVGGTIEENEISYVYLNRPGESGDFVV